MKKHELLLFLIFFTLTNGILSAVIASSPSHPYWSHGFSKIKVFDTSISLSTSGDFNFSIFNGAGKTINVTSIKITNLEENVVCHANNLDNGLIIAFGDQSEITASKCNSGTPSTERYKLYVAITYSSNVNGNIVTETESGELSGQYEEIVKMRESFQSDTKNISFVIFIICIGAIVGYLLRKKNFIETILLVIIVFLTYLVTQTDFFRLDNFLLTITLLAFTLLFVLLGLKKPAFLRSNLIALILILLLLFAVFWQFGV